jgi:hypothetical protein
MRNNTAPARPRSSDPNQIIRFRVKAATAETAMQTCRSATAFAKM